MFDFFAIGLIALLILLALAVAFGLRKAYESTPLSPVHSGKAHDHGHEHGGFSCKFDAEEVRRTEGQKRPRIEAPVGDANPRVAAILSAVTAGNIEKALKELSGELPITVGGQTVKLTGRNSYHGNIDLAMQYLEQYYSSLGMKFARHPYKVRGRNFNNLVVEIKGSKNPEKVLYLGAHLDSTAGWPWQKEENCPGADDDASGTVALMEIGRALWSMNPGCTVRLCHFTCEEQGLYGSYAYSDEVARKTGETVIGMIQMDMIGYCGNTANRVDLHDDVDRNGSHSLVVTLTQNAARYGLDLRCFDTHNRAVHNRSDHAGFLDHGFKAIMVSEEFTDRGFNPNYHTLGDRVSACNLPYMTEVVRMVLASAIELSEAS